MSYVTKGYIILSYVTKGYIILSYVTKGYITLSYVTKGYIILSYVLTKGYIWEDYPGHVLLFFLWGCHPGIL